MGKLSGYFLSSALVVVCLWVNISSFPNVVRSDALTGANAERKDDAKNVEETIAPSQEEASAPSQGESVEVQDEKADEQKDEGRQEPDSIDQETVNVSQTSGSIKKAASLSDLCREYEEIDGASSLTPKRSLKTSSKPQGGKYVNIPEIEVDAHRAKGDDRVIGVGFASVEAN